MPPPRTHHVAVAAYTFCGDRLLLLRRTYPPQTLAPPGGRLAEDEDPSTGLHRELFEETGLKVRVLGVAHVWFGSVDGEQPPLLCVNFIAEADDLKVTLSAEHSEHVWVTQQQIEEDLVETQTAAGHGYRASGIVQAFKLHDLLTTAGRTL